jgi:TPP-dependent pyruvate/acetoin dehydrogenase alpha subunit
MTSDRDLLLEAAKIRQIEEKIVEIYPTDLIQSPLHLSIGQESLAVGVCAHLTEQDQLFTTYRSHAYYLAKGGDTNAFMAELMGRVTGCCQGKGGSMHLADRAVNFMGTSAIVASTLPHAVGAAFANKLKKNNNIVVCVFGDGAADAGIYHESMNFASLHKLPIIFVLEDNGLAVHTSKSERQAFELIQHARSYNLMTYNLDETQSPVKVADLMRNVFLDVRMQERAAWVRLKAYRYREHVGTGEDFEAGYRDKSEFDSWYKEDPIASLDLTKNEQTSIDELISNAIDFGMNSPYPAAEDLFKDVN